MNNKIHNTIFKDYIGPLIHSYEDYYLPREYHELKFIATNEPPDIKGEVLLYFIKISHIKKTPEIVLSKEIKETVLKLLSHTP